MNVEQAKRAEKKMNKKYKNYSKLDMARMYSERGHVLIALQKNSKLPGGKYLENSLKTNPDVLLAIETHDINYGLLAKENLFMLDVDLKDQKDEEGNFISEKEAIERWNYALKTFNIPKTTTQNTTNGKGQHYMFKVTKHMKKNIKK